MSETRYKINTAILFQRSISFDYVSKDLSIKFDRHIKPRELKENWLYGYDLDDNNKLKRFLVDGIQKLKIIMPYENSKTDTSGDQKAPEGPEQNKNH